MMRKFFCYLVLLTVIGCNHAKDNEPVHEPLSLDKQLIGEWNNIYLKVESATVNNTDKNETLEVGYGEWEQKLRIRPIRTFFREDGSWNSAHYTLSDSLFYDPSGTWSVSADTLYMMQDKPSPDTTLYVLSIKNDTASFKALLDWDMDDRKDDLYFGKQKKVK